MRRLAVFLILAAFSVEIFATTPTDTSMLIGGNGMSPAPMSLGIDK